MEDTNILDDVVVGSDIEKILEEAKANSDLSAMRATKEYRLGRIEERMQICNERFSGIRERIAQPAEMFLYALHKIIPKGGILQYRIGRDYTAGSPVVFIVVSQKYEDKIPDIRRLASAFELYLYHECDCDCDFWPVSDRGLEQSLVDIDFPYYRENIYANV